MPENGMSIIHESVKLGKDIKIGRFCIIEKNAAIGNNTSLGDFTYIGENTQIGSNCSIGFHIFIGSNVQIGNRFKASSYCEIRSNCVVGDNVGMGSRCTLSAGTIVEDNVVMKYAFVATDTPKLGDSQRSVCILKAGSKFGASAVIMPGITIGENSEIGACSQVRHNVPPNEVMVWQPCNPLQKVAIQQKVKWSMN